MNSRTLTETKPMVPSNGDACLVPIPQPFSLRKSLAIISKTTLQFLTVIIIGPFVLLLLLLLVVSGVAPSIEWYLSSLDARALHRDDVLKQHPEMFLLHVPADVNGASYGKAYHLMVRLTKPPETNDLPPVIFPGGLASNLMTMSRHQDELTKCGFTVVNFDRLGVGLSDAYERDATRPPSALDVANEMNHVMTHIDGIDGDVKWIQVGGSMGSNLATAFACLYPMLEKILLEKIHVEVIGEEHSRHAPVGSSSRRS